MPKSTSTFIKSKMNKDTDSRILPPGEYRDAQNVSISKSEGSDVGALENVLGNRALVNINDLLSGVKNLEVIGHLMDLDNNRVLMMLTNYNDSSADQLSNFAPTESGHYIYSYNVLNGTTTQLVKGNFLNFSKTHPIYGINLLEDLLFWTDDRNQPRKINVELAIASPATSTNPYYTTEDQISVAKYYPYNPLRMYKALGPFSPTGHSGGLPVSGVTIYSGGVLRVGDIITLSDGSVTAQTTIETAAAVGANGEQAITWGPGTISIASGPPIPTFTFYRTGMEDASSNYLPQNVNTTLTNNPLGPLGTINPNWPGDKEFLKDKFVRFSYRYKFDDGEYSLIAPFTQPAFIPKQDGYFMATHDRELENFDENQAYVTTIVDFMENKVNNIHIELDTPANVKNLNNEYKITEIQILYKQSDENNIRILDTISYTDPEIAEHQGNLTYPITLSNAGTNYTSGATFTVTGGTGVGLTGTVTTAGPPGPVTAVTISNEGRGYVDGDIVTLVSAGSGNDATLTLAFNREAIYNYNYQSRKPILSLPADQTTRVSDIVPVRALAQSVAGNRIIYGNFLNKHTSPNNLNFACAASDRLQPWEANSIFSTVEYPNHSLKQNRTYQVGIVLADRYGRQSDVITSRIDNVIVGGFGGSTLYHDYRTSAENTTQDVLYWPGDSLKVKFDSPIPATIATPGYPGLYSATNPNGWYTYKVVVKQQEQEYYNVYLPSILQGNPFDTNDRNYVAYGALFSDNINKIPKDLNDVGPVQAKFRSSEQLWGRLENFIWTNSAGPPFNSASQTRQYYPELLSDQSIQVGTMDDLEVGVRGKIRAAHMNTTTISDPIIRVTSYNSKIQIGMGITSTNIKADSITLGHTTTVLYPGSGYSIGGALATTTDGSGAGLTITITAVDGDGAITDFNTNAGTGPTGYEAGDVVKISGGNNDALFIIDTERIINYEEFLEQANDEVKARITIGNGVNMTAYQGLEIDPQGETPDGTTKGTFFNEKNNPFVAKFRTKKPIGLPYTGSNRKYYNRLSVYETKPTFSNIDIFWETSAAGLISDLNTDVNDPGYRIPSTIIDASGVPNVVFDFNENDTSGTYITTNGFKIKDASGADITSDISVILANVYSGGNEITKQFTIEPQGSGQFKLKTTTTFVADADPKLNKYTFNIEVSESSGSNTYIYPLYLDTTISNTAPTITPVAPATCGGTLAGSISGAADTKIATFNGVNGSASTILNTQDLVWSIRNDDADATPYTGTDFELRDPTTPTAGQKELWVNSGTPAQIDTTLKIRTMDGPGAYVDCALTFTIT